MACGDRQILITRGIRPHNLVINTLPLDIVQAHADVTSHFHVPRQRIYRVYASALTQLNIDRYNRVPTTDVRLLRRIVRDARTRGYSAAETIGRWESVHKGERDFIFPYQVNADVMFNSALAYELSALKPLAEPLLLQIEPGKPGHIEAKRLLTFLQWFEPIPVDPIPDNSILREFVGGSNLERFRT